MCLSTVFVIAFEDHGIMIPSLAGYVVLSRDRLLALTPPGTDSIKAISSNHLLVNWFILVRPIIEFIYS